MNGPRGIKTKEWNLKKSKNLLLLPLLLHKLHRIFQITNRAIPPGWRRIFHPKRHRCKHNLIHKSGSIIVQIGLVIASNDWQCKIWTQKRTELRQKTQRPDGTPAARARRRFNYSEQNFCWILRRHWGQCQILFNISSSSSSSGAEKNVLFEKWVSNFNTSPVETHQLLLKLTKQKEPKVHTKAIRAYRQIGLQVVTS